MSIVKIVLSSFVLCLALSANAFDPKSKPIQVIMPFAPGGGVDQTFRHLQKYAANKGIVMAGLYKPGGEGIVSINELINSPKDGYVVSVTTAAVIAENRVRGTDVLPITAIRDNITSILSSVKSNLTTVDDLERAIKNGDKISLGHGAPAQKLVLEQFVEFTKTKREALLVPYKGGAPVINDLVAGHIDVGVVPYSVAKNHIASGKVNLLAIAAKEKPKGINAFNIEQKYAAWQHYDGFALVVANGTNAEAVKWWSGFMQEYLNDPQVQNDFLAENTVASEFGVLSLEKTIKASVSRLQKK
jgi:tripartite-type tricarboxylate transporter receptor subunit TctC